METVKCTPNQEDRISRTEGSLRRPFTISSSGNGFISGMRTGRLVINADEGDTKRTASSKVLNVFKRMKGEDVDEKGSPIIEQTPKKYNIQQDPSAIMPPPPPPEMLDHGQGGADKSSAFRSAITHLLCGIYALVLIVLGLVLPMSDALTHDMERRPTFYVEVFHLYIYLVSLLFLVYLHAFLLRQRDDQKVVRNIRLVSNNQLDSPDKSAFAVQESSDISSSHSKGENRSRSRTPSDVDLEPYQPTRAVTHDSEGVNFYLRLGAIGFGTGSMIHDGFRIAQVFENGMSLDCFGPISIVVAVMHLLFCFFQTYFLFKSHKITINKHKAFVRFGLTHIVASNICVWFLTTIMETAEDFRNMKNDDVTPVTMVTVADDGLLNFTTTAATVGENSSSVMGGIEQGCTNEDTLARRSAPYLYPCTIEYSLIAAAIVFKMYQCVGRTGKQVLTITGDSGSNQTDCDKANKGLFLGLFITILTLVSVSSFFVFDEKLENRDTASLIFYTTEITLLFLSCVIVIIGFFKLQQLRFSVPEEGSYDTVLLVIALFGLCTFNAFLVVSSVSTMEEYGLIGILSLGTSALAFIQAAIQTIFILDGLRRCAENDEHVNHKPGRTLVTFLLLCNLSLWVINTFEVKKAETMPLHSHFYGFMPWNIIAHICIPLIIFFRFHSTVCLSDIWINAYIIKRKEL